VFEFEIQDFPFAKQSKNQIFYAEFAQSLRLLSITIASPSFSRCPPRSATRKMPPARKFHQISIDDFALLGDVARFGFRPMRIGMAAIVDGCHPRFK
jgi:hypothetical protein